MKKFERREPKGIIGSFHVNSVPVLEPEVQLEIQQTQPILTLEEFEKQQKLYYEFLQEQQRAFDEQQYKNYLELVAKEQETRDALEDEKKNLEIDMIIRRCHKECISSNHYWKPNLIDEGESVCADKCMKKLKKLLPIWRPLVEKNFTGN